MKNSWRHPVIGAIMGLIAISLKCEYFFAIRGVFFGMIINEILQLFKLVDYKYLFIPVFHKPKIQKYSKQKWIDTFWDIVLETLGCMVTYWIAALVKII